MCEYCKEEKEQKGIKHDYLYGKIRGKSLMLGYDAYSVDSSFETNIEIRYCPFCGKEL